jgi:hypothetical protein
MCFSATASFGASALLLVIGATSIRKSTTGPQRLLSCIPLIFCVQQFSEGVLWLSLTHPDSTRWDKMATYGFLVFAQVIWPTFLPFSVFMLEKNRKTRIVLAGLLGLGIAISSILAYTLIFNKVQSSVSCYHIQYDVEYPNHFKHSGIFYLAATIIPLIISGIKPLHKLGAIMFIAYVATRIFYQYYLISVWCFFAAIISVMILYIIIDINRQAKTVTETEHG